MTKTNIAEKDLGTPAGPEVTVTSTEPPRR
jgi:hypothetical protein